MKLIKNYLYNVGYQIFVLFIPLITVPYVSRVIGSEGVGINAYTNSIISYFVLFGSIGISLYGNRTIAYNRGNKQLLSRTFWEIAILRICTIIISYAFFICFMLVISKYQKFYFYQSFMILAAAFDISWFFMGMEDFKKTVIRNFLVKIISLLAIFLLVKTPDDLDKYILILSVSTLLGNLTLWPYLKSVVNKPKFSELNILVHILPSIALFVPQIATQIYLVLNKTMLGYMTDVQNVGFYENSDKLVKIVLAVVTATGTVMLPRMANVFSLGNIQKVNQYLKQSFDFVSSICFPMALGLAAIAPKFSTWFFGKEFAITGQIIPILSIVIIFIGWSNVLGTQYLLPTNQTKKFTISVTIGALVNLLLNFPLINFYGIYGAVIATVISELAVTIIQLIYIKNDNRSINLFNGVWKYFVSSLGMFLVVRYLNTIMPLAIIGFLVQFLVGLIIYIAGIYLMRASVINQVKTFLKNRQ